jgi:cytochrome P450
MDFVADFAAHVPGHVIGSLLGVPDEDCPQLRIWSEDIVQYFDADRTEDRKQLAERATTEFSEYLVALIAERSKQPRDDLLSTLVRARDAGEMNESELISLAMLILAGGHGSTIDVLGNGMYALLKNPEQLAKLRSNPALIHSAVQEMFRFDSPLPFFHRFASKDVEVMGKTYPRGTRFGLLYGSANRDQMQFPDADRFDISRNPNRHVAFGRGAHLCLGNNLARLDMEIVFLTLLRRIQSIELTSDEVVYKPGLSARGIRQLPLRVMA